MPLDSWNLEPEAESSTYVALEDSPSISTFRSPLERAGLDSSVSATKGSTSILGIDNNRLLSTPSRLMTIF